LKLTILGSGGSAVSANRACPSFVLDDSIIFDLGPGSLKNLRSSKINPDNLSQIFISHTHADHISDLIPLLWAMQIDNRQHPLAIHGPPSFKKKFQGLLECTSTSADFIKFPLTVSELDFGSRLGNVSTCMTNHSIPTMAFRVNVNGRSLCYSADTTYCPAVANLATDADVLLHEATFLQDQGGIAELTRHSTAGMAGRIAKEAKAKRLILFHIPPPNEHREQEFLAEATASYARDVTIARDMESLEI